LSWVKAEAESDRRSGSAFFLWRRQSHGSPVFAIFAHNLLFTFQNTNTNVGLSRMTTLLPGQASVYYSLIKVSSS
jgi:hypothetical protein